MALPVPHTPLPLDQSDVRYAYGPDSVPQTGVPEGRTVAFTWDRSSTYPGTTRTVWIHVPAAYDERRPAGLIVFQDGAGFLDPDDDFRAATVLDNLVHRGDIPVTIGVFVDPGVFAQVADPKARRNRNVEYDAFDDRYADFLVDEILEQVRDRYAISDDPERWAICGFSSGGNCAFTAAWRRSDSFRRVFASLSSFAQMPGGNPYPDLIATVERKPLRIALQAGQRDLGWDEPEDNWLAENLRIAAALAEAGYDSRLLLGDGGHDANHAGVLLPDVLRWLLGPSTAADGGQLSRR